MTSKNKNQKELGWLTRLFLAHLSVVGVALYSDGIFWFVIGVHPFIYQYAVFR